jgi:hypothetical protein
MYTEDLHQTHTNTKQTVPCLVPKRKLHRAAHVYNLAFFPMFWRMLCFFLHEVGYWFGWQKISVHTQPTLEGIYIKDFFSSHENGKFCQKKH